MSKGVMVKKRHTQTAARPVVVMIVASAMLLGTATVSAAAESDEIDLLATITKASPELVGATAFDARVTLPASTGDALEFGDKSARVSVALPFADTASQAKAIGSGTLSYDNGNGSHTVPAVHTDGSVQIFTVIEHATAPTRYEYSLSLPPGSRSELLEEGGLLVTDESGALVLGIVPPWAKDAHGEAVKTWYEWDGARLVQVVEHGDGSAYPIVADPWMGNDLLSSAGWRSISGGWEVWAYATSWGRTFNGLATHASHVAELKSRLGSNAWRVDWNGGTIREQFLCHVAGNYFEQGQYNMESYRPAVHWATQLNPWDRCNPS